MHTNDCGSRAKSERINETSVIEYRPSIEELRVELARVKYRQRYQTVLKSTIYTLVTVAAIAVLVATLWLPALQIYGKSMTPTLQDGEIVFSVKSSDFKQGDIIAFYYNNKILVKRVIATSGDWIVLDEQGNVYVNQVLLDEPYLEEKSFGDADITFPYQVPEDAWFVMGDHRSTSVDSRHREIGCVSEEQIVGKIVFRVWPLDQLGGI